MSMQAEFDKETLRLQQQALERMPQYQNFTKKLEQQKLLDQFACAALTGLLASNDYTVSRVAWDAYGIAQDMLKARNEQA